MIPVNVQLDEGAKLPTRAHTTDVGYDVTALTVNLVDFGGDVYTIKDAQDLENLQKLPGIVPYKLKIDTGIHLQPQTGYYFELAPNSRIGKTCLMLANSIGIIDESYTGSVRLILNIFDPCACWEDLENYIPGKTCGQLILKKRLDAHFQLTPNLLPTDRADGGFGSTAH